MDSKSNDNTRPVRRLEEHTHTHIGERLALNMRVKTIAPFKRQSYKRN